MAKIDKEALKAEAQKKAKLAKEKAQAEKMRRKRAPSVEMPEPTGNPEIDSEADLNAVQQGFRDRIKNENKRFELATDTEFWFACAAQTRAGKEDLLEQLGILQDGDKYITAKDLANAINALVEKGQKVELKEEDKVPYRSEGKIDKDFAQFV